MDAFETGLVWIAPIDQAELVARVLTEEGLAPRQRAAAAHRHGQGHVVIAATIEKLSALHSRECHAAVERALSTIERLIDRLPTGIAGRDGRVKLSIMWGLERDEHSGFVLEVDEIRRLAALNCELWLDIYDGAYSSSKTSASA